MANEVNNPNEIAHAQIGFSASGEEQVKKSIQSVIDKLGELQKMSGEIGLGVGGGGGGGSGGSGGGGGGGGGGAGVSSGESALEKKFREAEKALDDLEDKVQKLNGNGDVTGNSDKGIVGLVGGLRKMLGLFGALSSFVAFKRIAEEINNAAINVEKLRGATTNLIAGPIGMSQSAADMNVSATARIAGIDPILLTAPSQRPAQRAARAQIAAESEQAMANLIEVERVVGANRGMTSGLSDAFPSLFAGSNDVAMARSRVDMQASSAQKLMQAAARSDAFDVALSIRKGFSSQRR